MKFATRLWALLAVSTLALSCDESPTAPGDAPIGFETVMKSSISGFSTPRHEVIRTAADWAVTWDLLHAGQSQVPARPGIDFDREMVLLAAMGTGTNSCYDVEITAIRLRGTELEIDVQELEPGADCICLQVITQPVHAVRLGKLLAADSFVVRRRMLGC